MSDTGISARGLTYGATLLLTPIVLWMLARAFPARASSSVKYQALYARHRTTETLATVCGIAAIWAAIFVMVFARVGNTPWFVGVAVGWLALASIIIIAIRTLPHGIAEWQEFWRFHEMHHRVSLAVIAPLYAVLSLLGVVSTFVIVARQ